VKVAVTSQGSVLSSELDPRFGRARYFVVVDTESGEFVAHDNGANLEAAHGAGIQAAQDVVNLGAEAVITGNLGPKAATALRAGNVKVYRQTWGTVRDAIEQFKAGRLQEISDADAFGG
jgi:predicted Fe-Mo cluster-binding NifX family protein